jgi:mRNA interferase MazF
VSGRGEIWWADLGPRRGSAPADRRPVLVVSSDAFNRSSIATVICVALTSTIALADAPGNVALTRADSGLARRSVANVSQVVTLDKRDLVERVGRIDRRTMRQVDAGLRLALSL